MGWESFWQTIADPRVLASYKVTFTTSFWAAAVNGVFGLIIAWVLVRYEFPGRRLVDAVVDLPFALPTAVAGITLTTLYAPNGWLGRPLAAFGIPVAFTPTGHNRRADLHRPAVRHPRAAAGDPGAGPRARGGRDEPGSAALAGHSSRDPALLSCRPG